MCPRARDVRSTTPLLPPLHSLQPPPPPKWYRDLLLGHIQHVPRRSFRDAAPCGSLGSAAWMPTGPRQTRAPLRRAAVRVHAARMGAASASRSNRVRRRHTLVDPAVEQCVQTIGSVDPARQVDGRENTLLASTTTLCYREVQC